MDDLAPWVPAGLTFEVGQRVRIRLSAECHFRGEVLPGKRLHYHEEDGKTGHIRTNIDDKNLYPGHPFCVEFDEVFPSDNPGREVFAALFAYSELTPLDADGKEIQP